MAAIPTFVYFGDQQISGGVPGGLTRGPAGRVLAGLVGGLYGVWSQNYKFSRVVPSTADGVTAPVGSFNPYWDGITGGGSFVRFHYAASSDTGAQLATKGDNWYENPTTDGDGAITPTPLFINKLWERYPAGFKFIKYAQAGGFNSGSDPWADGGAGYLGGVGVVQGAASFLAGLGDTLDIKAIVIDCSMTDLANLALVGYKAAAQSFISNIRADIGAPADCHIILVNPHPDASPNVAITTPAATLTLRQLNIELAAENDNVHVFDMSWASTWQSGINVSGANQPGVYPAAGSRRYYGAEDYVQAGARLGNFVIAATTAAPAATPGSAIPVVAMIGDSQFVGVIPSSFIELTNQESLVGPNSPATVRAGQYIWNSQNQQVELYDVMVNGNTFGTAGQSTFGPDATLLKKLGERYPSGCVVFKYAKNSATLTTEASASLAVEATGIVWDDIVAEWQAFKQACLDQLGRSPDLVGVVTDIGGNDAVTQAAATAFATKAATFVDSIRSAFPTRAEGAALPIIWLQVPPPFATGGNSQHNPGPTQGTRVGTVRSAIAALPSQKTRVAVLPNTGDADYELQRTDRIHYGAEACLQIGYDLADALFEILDSEEGETTAAEAGPSGAAAFTVETGSGSASANSYCSTATATSYHETYGNPTAWSSASLIEQQDALRQATRALDIRYGSWWSGVRAGSTQALDWPRAYVYDQAGNAVPTTTIPTRLQQATAILALLHIQGEDILPDTSTTADIRSETLSSASGASKSVTYIGGKRAETQYPIVDRMLASAGLTSGGAGWGWLDL